MGVGPHIGVAREPLGQIDRTDVIKENARPDHVPLLHGETGENSGYSMQGRLFAVGFMRGLVQAVQSEKV